MSVPNNEIKLPENLTPAQDRAAGAIMGVLIGDAMAVGPHWFYDLDEMRQAYGGELPITFPFFPTAIMLV